MPDTIEPKLINQARQLAVLASAHSYMLERVSSTLDNLEGAAALEKLLTRMANCVPRGGLFERSSRADLFQRCRCARLCPWCHARSVERLNELLQQGPCSEDNLAGKHLVIGRLQIPSNIPGIPPRTEGDRIHDIAWQTKHVRIHWGNWLKQWATNLGMAGGIILYQVGPYVSYQYSVRYRDFVHELSVLGEVQFSSEQDITSFQQETGMVSGYYSPRALLKVGPGPREATQTIWAMLPGAQRNALRYLLAGTSYKFPVDRLELSVTTAWDTKYGLSGIAALQPWFLFTEEQFRAYHFAMQGTRMYDAFGIWREMLRSKRPRPSACSISSRIESVLKKQRRLSALRQVNDLRQIEAQTRRERLMDVAAPICGQLVSQLGRAPGSPAIRNALAAASYSISDRDARWLAARVRENC